MDKRKCVLIGLHAILIAGITAGYVCMYKQQEKCKLNTSIEY